MTLVLNLPPDVEARVRSRAKANGQDPSAYVAQLIARFGQPPTPLEELSGPIYQRFVESGMSDDELAEELERAKHEMRAERRARNAT
jgi:hypothetical protein